MMLQNGNFQMKDTITRLYRRIEEKKSKNRWVKNIAVL